jgi:hypothetical protein
MFTILKMPINFLKMPKCFLKMPAFYFDHFVRNDDKLEFEVKIHVLRKFKATLNKLRQFKLTVPIKKFTILLKNKFYKNALQLTHAND